jgi:hypothetical protein
MSQVSGVLVGSYRRGSYPMGQFKLLPCLTFADLCIYRYCCTLYPDTYPILLKGGVDVYHRGDTPIA